MDEKKLTEIRNSLYLIENQLNELQKYTFNKAAWEAAYHSGVLQEMITLLSEPIIALQKLSDLKNTNMNTPDQGLELGQNSEPG
jgi:hypothetical protein